MMSSQNAQQYFINTFKQKVSLAAKPALAARSLPDREKFAFAKEHGSIELLLELINCDETAHVANK
jgi:hypothetical protein